MLKHAHADCKRPRRGGCYNPASNNNDRTDARYPWRLAFYGAVHTLRRARRLRDRSQSHRPLRVLEPPSVQVQRRPRQCRHQAHRQGLQGHNAGPDPQRGHQLLRQLPGCPDRYQRAVPGQGVARSERHGAGADQQHDRLLWRVRCGHAAGAREAQRGFWPDAGRLGLEKQHLPRAALLRAEYHPRRGRTDRRLFHRSGILDFQQSPEPTGSSSGCASSTHAATCWGRTSSSRAAAVDRYAFLRDGYLQLRRNQIYDGNPPSDDSVGSPRRKTLEEQERELELDEPAPTPAKPEPPK